MCSTAWAAARISVMTFFLSRRTTYSGSKPFSTSTPRRDLGRSLTCPTDAFTVKPAPRYFLIVRALAGDSTMTSDLPLGLTLRPFFSGSAVSVSASVSTTSSARARAGLVARRARAGFSTGAGPLARAVTFFSATFSATFFSALALLPALTRGFTSAVGRFALLFLVVLVVVAIRVRIPFLC